jgi:hypothetical protein
MELGNLSSTFVFPLLSSFLRYENVMPKREVKELLLTQCGWERGRFQKHIPEGSRNNLGIQCR